jgi:hypothetical protein
VLMMEKVRIQDAQLFADTELFWICDEGRAVVLPGFVAVIRPAPKRTHPLRRSQPKLSGKSSDLLVRRVAGLFRLAHPVRLILCLCSLGLGVLGCLLCPLPGGGSPQPHVVGSLVSRIHHVMQLMGGRFKPRGFCGRLGNCAFLRHSQLKMQSRKERCRESMLSLRPFCYLRLSVAGG